MLLNHLEGILNYHRTKVPLGMVEAITETSNACYVSAVGISGISARRPARRNYCKLTQDRLIFRIKLNDAFELRLRRGLFCIIRYDAY